jgi:ribosomal protein L37E
MLRILVVVATLVAITSLSWADGFRPGTDPWGSSPSYRQTPGGTWYQPGVDPYPGDTEYRYGYGQEYRNTDTGSWYRPGVDPYPGGRRWRSNDKTALYVMGAALIVGLQANHDRTPAPICANCGQQASSTKAQYCSRCGVPLRSNAVVPRAREPQPQAGTFSPAPD